MVKVATYGTFDLFHKGHYRLLQRAKALGDYLIVGVTTEEYDIERGKLNVVDSLMTRIENVRKTGFADEIIIESSGEQKVSDIKKYGIDIITVGSDWVGKFDHLKQYCEVVYLERTKGISSTMLREENRTIIRLGIVGNGRIADRFVPESKAVSGINIQGVYNPHIESAAIFADRHEIDFYPDLEEMYNEVDAVYVASPHQTHYEYIKDALNHGKHVLAEKPMVLKKSEAEELFALAREKNLVLFEAIKTAYCPGFNQLINLVGSGVIGDVKSVEATFTKLEGPQTRELTDTVYGGSFRELATYCLLPAIKSFGTHPEKVSFDVIRREDRLDLFTKAHLVYKNGIATATCGLGVKSEGQCVISGTTGYVLVPAPWWKTVYFEVRREDPRDVERYSATFKADGMRYEISDFLSAINGRSRSEFKLNAEESVTLAGIIEEFGNDR